MLNYVLLVPALVLLALGLEGIHNARHSRTPADVTCAQLRQSPPPSLSLHVTDCDLDYLGAAYREVDGTMEELFLPARASGAPATQPAPLVIATQDPRALAVAQRVLGTRAPASAQSVQTMQKAAAAVGLPTEIRGLVRAGVIERLAARQVLAGLSTPLAENVLVLDLNTARGVFWPVVMCALGLLLPLAGALASRRNKPVVSEFVPDPADRATVLERLIPYTERAAKTDEPDLKRRIGGTAFAGEPEAPAAVSASPRTSASPSGAAGEDSFRLPSLMLLKLDASAGPDSIELAPPLGTRQDVTARLREVFPDLDIDPTGHGTHEGPDHALAVDLGREETVHTAILDARGPTGITAVRWVLETTGWRAFVPKAGRFVDPEALDELIIRDTAPPSLRRAL
jgi:hypothetical protein